jgi:hypothetical protein
MWRARGIIYISLPFKRTLIWISVPNGPYAKPHSPGEWYCRSCGLLRDAVKWEVHRLLGVTLSICTPTWVVSGLLHHVPMLWCAALARDLNQWGHPILDLNLQNSEPK